MVNLETLSEVKGATISLFADQWLKNFEENRSEIMRSPGIKRLGNKFTNIPAVIVGVGPSLDKNIKFLKYASGRALVIACDAALKVLLNEGIKPNFVTTLDPQKDIIRFFKGLSTRDLTLIAPTVVHPEVLKCWQGKVVFYNKFAPDIPVLAKIQQAVPHVGELIPGGTVLSISYSLAFQAGADPITFVGQDLCYMDRMAYAHGTIYDDEPFEKIIQGKQDVIVDDVDIFGKSRQTLKSMFITRQWLEWAFTTWKRNGACRIMNSTEGGILRDKCELHPLKLFLNGYCANSFNFDWKIKKLLKYK